MKSDEGSVRERADALSRIRSALDVEAEREGAFSEDDREFLEDCARAAAGLRG